MENNASQQQKALLDAVAEKVAAQQAGRGGIANLAAAFVAAKKEIQNPTKNRQNPHFGNDYATLDAVLGCFTAAFAENDLALIQAPGEISPDGHVTVIGLLVHKSGESIQFRTQVPLGPKATAQAAGSAITYARRYQAAAIAGVSQVDDDGNAASSDPGPKAGKAAKAKAADPATADTKQALLSQIAAAPDVATLETLKSQIADLGDQSVADTYVARRKELKSAKAVQA